MEENPNRQRVQVKKGYVIVFMHDNKPFFTATDRIFSSISEAITSLSLAEYDDGDWAKGFAIRKVKVKTIIEICEKEDGENKG